MLDESRTIVEQARAVTAASAGHLPPDVREAFTADQAARAAAGVPAGVAQVGSALPESKLLDIGGKPVTLSAVRAGRPAVVVLYRGVWCPYCNIALRTYQTELSAELAARGIALIAISPELPDHAVATADNNELDFPVLSDPNNDFAGALGVVIEQPAAVVQAQAKLGLNLADHNAGGVRTLPMPTVVVTDAAGVIRWIDVHPDYTSRTEVSAIRSAVNSLDGPRNGQ